MYSHLVDDSEHKKTKSKMLFRHNEYEDVLLNKKYLRHSMNKIQSKDHRVGTHKINNIYMSCFDDKIYIQKYRCDGLAPGYHS